MVTLHTNFGDIKLDLNAEKAPKTVANFIKYVESGHYDNTIFHRVIDGFMIQGGGFAAGMEEKPTNKPVKNEANNGLSNTKYSVAMARTMEPHSASAQFFINLNDNKFLDFKSETTDGWGYCVFAQVVEGVDVVDKIRNVATGNSGYVHQDVPLEDVIIKSVTIV
ncbi:Peptidylprolyl isomerase [Psychromonas ingrahamii 37]|uniref:Peptidyl-prolyl cis-trans isomerase n=1 Tax=Psychromonas ingrahamii (strain DSM 17664 / CCUG 51855 / 37) TaxID=357804 RepID=A1SWR1_PSYIN|nr:peptidylprolyl isomerase [Psychromonas ingrahamii]ABM03926.1 Peptidylprolyl isomerase [Psychromonas ingrahamii 37]